MNWYAGLNAASSPPVGPRAVSVASHSSSSSIADRRHGGERSDEEEQGEVRASGIAKRLLAPDLRTQASSSFFLSS